MLDDYGQRVVALRGADGDPDGQLGHTLKVFLVQADGDVRNIYSAGLLAPELLMNDVATVLEVLPD